MNTPGQFKTEMKPKTYQEFEAQHKKMYPDHNKDQIQAAWETYNKYFKMEEAQNLVSKGISTLDGKKIDGARSSKLFLQGLDADGFLHNLSWKEWSESDLEDTSSDSAKKQFVDRLVKQIKMFNKRIDLNTFLKSGKISFIDTVNYIFKLDPNIKYSKASGLKEDTVQEAVSESRDNFDVDKMLDDAAKLKKDFPVLRKGQSIMITLRDMNPTLYKKAAARYNVFYVDEKIPELITFLDPTKFLDPKYRIGNDEIYEAINIGDYITTSEKSQFGGYRPKVVNKSGKLFYLGQASYNTPFEAKDRAENYLQQYARGISQPKVPIKGTYGLKEEKEHYDSWIIKPRDGGQQVKIKAPDETSAIEIALGRKPSQNEIDFFNFHYILIQEKTNVVKSRHMKIVELATKCADPNLVEEFVEQQYKPQTSASEIKESFRSFIANKN